MTAAVAAPRLSFTAERRFFTGTALAGLAVTVVGFAPTWFLMRWFAAPPLPGIVHLHGALFTAWIALYLAQTTLVAAGRRDVHRQLGLGATVLAAAMLVLGVAVAIEGARRGVGPPDRNQAAFIINPLTNIVTFAVLFCAAIAQRRRAAWHKRLMLLTMLPILTTPLARISGMLHLPVPGPVGGMLMANIFLLALAGYDWKSLGKLHPATLWGGAFLMASEAMRIIVGPTAAWQAFATALIG